MMRIKGGKWASVAAGVVGIITLVAKLITQLPGPSGVPPGGTQPFLQNNPGDNSGFSNSGTISGNVTLNGGHNTVNNNHINHINSSRTINNHLNTNTTINNHINSNTTINNHINSNSTINNQKSQVNSNSVLSQNNQVNITPLPDRNSEVNAGSTLYHQYHQDGSILLTLNQTSYIYPIKEVATGGSKDWVDNPYSATF